MEKAKFTREIKVCRSEFGTREPSIIVTRIGGNFRHMHAEIHRIAATVELATPDSCIWNVATGTGESISRVWLELTTDNDAEFELGMDVLRKAAE